MTHYLIALGVILLANVMPAFAPPTWSLLVYFSLAFHLHPIALFFAAGRTVSYTFYVAGSSALKASSYGEIFLKELTSPTAIVIQVAMVIALLAIGLIPWKRILQNK
jgi:hypothetical protein